MRTLYIVKTGSTFPAIAQQHGDFEDWIAQGMLPKDLLAAEHPAVQVIDAVAHKNGALTYPSLQMCAGVVVSGSHAMVTDHAPWMQGLAAWLYSVCTAGIPVLGICFGHQLLTNILGGQVGAHPAGLEMGTVPVAIQTDVSQDPVWKDMPACFDAHVVHYQSVCHLPKGASVLAGNSHDPHQAFRWQHNVWGVQFHPEFSEAAMQGYINHVMHDLGPCDQAALRCAPTPEAAQLLSQFTRHAMQWAQQQKLSNQAG